MDRSEIEANPILKLLADLFATPYGQEVAKRFNTAKDVSSGVATDVAMTPVRVSDLVSRSVDAGGFENMDPSEVGRASLEAGSIPLAGAVGGAPRNAAGMVVQHEGADPRKYAAAGAGVAGAATVGSDIYDGEFKGLSQDYIMDVLGPNMLYGAGAGFGLGLGALGVGAADDALRTSQSTKDLKKWGEWAAEAERTGRRAKKGPTKNEIDALEELRRTSTPGGPSSPGAGRPGNAPQGSSPQPPKSGPANTPKPPPSAPGTGQPSGGPTRSQSGGNQTSRGTSGAPNDEYGPLHTTAARAYLEGLFDPSNPRGATPAQIAAELVPFNQILKQSTPASTRTRAAKTMGILAETLPKDLSSVDRATLTRLIREATGKPGTLAVPLTAGVGGAAAMSDPALEALLTEILGGGG